MKDIIFTIIKIVQWTIAGILAFIAYGGLQGNEVAIPAILLAAAILITPPVIKLIFGRRKKKKSPAK